MQAKLLASLTFPWHGRTVSSFQLTAGKDCANGDLLKSTVVLGSSLRFVFYQMRQRKNFGFVLALNEKTGQNQSSNTVPRKWGGSSLGGAKGW